MALEVKTRVLLALPRHLEAMGIRILRMSNRSAENRRRGCTNRPLQADVFRATAVEDICDGRQKYVRRPSHETSVADMEMA